MGKRADTCIIAVAGVLCMAAIGAGIVWKYPYFHQWRGVSPIVGSQPIPDSPVSVRILPDPEILNPILQRARQEVADADMELEKSVRRLAEIKRAREHNTQAGMALQDAERDVTVLSRRAVEKHRVYIALEDRIANAQLSESLSNSNLHAGAIVFSDEYQKLIDAAVGGLRSANIAFNTPKAIDVTRTQRITLAISFDMAQPALQDSVSPNGPAEGDAIKAAPEMEALLTHSSGLAVTPLQASSPQAVASRGVTYWNWDVEGRSSGRQSLTLTITAVYSMAPGAPRQTVKVFRRDLTVRVSAPQRLREFAVANWQWLWGVLAVPLGGWLWRHFHPPKRQLTPSRPWRRRERQGV